jgi:hypothetical protein
VVLIVLMVETESPEPSSLGGVDETSSIEIYLFDTDYK